MKRAITPPLSPMERQGRTRGLPALTYAILMVACIVATAALVACGAGPSAPTQAPSAATPPAAVTTAADGATLLETRCSVCHSVDRAKQARMTADGWDQTVTLMIGKGAKLTEAEKKVLVDYLAETYGQ